MENFLEVVRTFISIAGVIVPLIMLFWFNKREETFKQSLTKQNYIYELKINVLIHALNVVDKYVSKQKFAADGSSGEVYPFSEDFTDEELTIEMRKCYNDLSLHCENADTLKEFIQIFEEKNKGELLKRYNDLRNAFRKELNVQGEIELNNEKVIMAQLHTEKNLDLRGSKK